MRKIKNHKQMYLINPWDYLGPKRQKMLDESWAGLFQREVLTSLPVDKLAPYFDKSFGRPTKELHTVLGVLILQQSFDLTDMETVEQLAFNIQWHYALNIADDSDSEKYMCPKTLWSMRNIVATNNLDGPIFEDITSNLAEAFKVDPTHQRLDSTHIKSNMKRLGRIGIFTETIHKFLVNLKRRDKEQLNSIDKELKEKYLSDKAMECFSKVKPSQSRKTLNEVSKDLFELVQLFKNNDEVKAMHSYKLLERVLNEQCNLTDSDDEPVEIKKPKDIPSDSLQNPSDPDATYSGHKGQGYQVQIMETYSKDDEEKGLNLITHVHVEPAHNSDAHALIPAIESAKDRKLAPEEILADTAYGSDENCESAKEFSVEVVAPVNGAPKEERVSISEFETSDKGKIISCPQGHNPIKVKRKNNRFTAKFDKGHCSVCPLRESCPAQEGKKFYYIRYTGKEMRIAKRRVFEATEEFKDRYRWRAGIEATMSKYKRLTGVKQLRVRGLKAVRYCATLKALAINMFRAAAVLIDQKIQNPDGFCPDLDLFQIILYVKEQFFSIKKLFSTIFKLDVGDFCSAILFGF